jgi:hypothetical protein
LAKRLWDLAVSTVKVADEVTRLRWGVLSQALPWAILQVLGHVNTRSALLAQLQVSASELELALKSLSHAELIRIHADQITLNRWTLELLERDLQALSTGKATHAAR